MGDAAFHDPRFIIQHRLGAGGMGVVYQALDREQHRVVALKTLRVAEGLSIARFKHELRALAAHPERLFFTMELVVGKSLIRWVRNDDRGEADEPSTEQESTSLDGPATGSTEPGRKRPSESPSPRRARPAGTRRPALDLTRLRPALPELAEGVAALHAAGMLHRDLKPSSIPPLYMGMSGPKPLFKLHMRVIEGLLLPFRAGKLLLADRDLLARALKPVLLLAAVCAAVALITAWPGAGTVRRFYQVFAALAPLPSILFASEYARLAAEVRRRATGVPAEPHEEPLGESLARLVKQVLLSAAAIAPLTLLLRLIPGVGSPLAKALVAGWAVHWVVVNALESARVRGGAEAADEPDPWFVRGARSTGERVPLLRPATHVWASLCGGLARPWRRELRVMERHPALVAGFAATTALLLCTPVLNLFFRPVVVAASVLLLTRAEVDATLPECERLQLPSSSLQ